MRAVGMGIVPRDRVAKCDRPIQRSIARIRISLHGSFARVLRVRSREPAVMLLGGSGALMAASFGVWTWTDQGRST